MKQFLFQFSPAFAMVFVLGFGVTMDLRQRARAERDRAALVSRVQREVVFALERQDYLDEARRQFPDLRNPSSPLYLACVARWIALTESASPLLSSPDWPLTVAEEEARRLGLSPTIVLR